MSHSELDICNIYPNHRARACSYLCYISFTYHLAFGKREDCLFRILLYSCLIYDLTYSIMCHTYFMGHWSGLQIQHPHSLTLKPHCCKLVTIWMVCFPFESQGHDINDGLMSKCQTKAYFFQGDAHVVLFPETEIDYYLLLITYFFYGTVLSWHTFGDTAKNSQTHEEIPFAQLCLCGDFSRFLFQRISSHSNYLLILWIIIFLHSFSQSSEPLIVLAWVDSAF